MIEPKPVFQVGLFETLGFAASSGSNGTPQPVGAGAASGRPRAAGLHWSLVLVACLDAFGDEFNRPVGHQHMAATLVTAACGEITFRVVVIDGAAHAIGWQDGLERAVGQATVGPAGSTTADVAQQEVRASRIASCQGAVAVAVRWSVGAATGERSTDASDVSDDRALVLRASDFTNLNRIRGSIEDVTEASEVTRRESTALASGRTLGQPAQVGCAPRLVVIEAGADFAAATVMNGIGSVAQAGGIIRVS